METVPGITGSETPARPTPIVVPVAAPTSSLGSGGSQNTAGQPLVLGQLPIPNAAAPASVD